MKTRLRRHAVAVAVFAVVASACGASSDGVVEDANGDCTPNPPASGPVTFGDGGPGDSCEHASDCSSTCCTCASGGKFLAAECVGGSCADEQTACDDEQKLFESQGISPCQ